MPKGKLLSLEIKHRIVLKTTFQGGEKRKHAYKTIQNSSHQWYLSQLRTKTPQSLVVQDFAVQFYSQVAECILVNIPYCYKAIRG